MLSDLKLPADVSKYKETKVFNATTVPKGLLKDHATKADVWGKLQVHVGTVMYVDVASAKEREVTSGSFQIIEPEALHFIQPSEEAEFHVEFYRSDTEETGSPHKGKSLF